MSGADLARTLTRYAALRRSRRKARRQQPLFGEVAFQESAEAAMLPALVEGARSRLPACAGPFHKGTLTLNALSSLAGSEPGAAGRLVQRYRRLVALRRSLED